MPVNGFLGQLKIVERGKREGLHKGIRNSWKWYVHHLDFDGDFMDVYVCQNLSNCIL